MKKQVSKRDYEHINKLLIKVKRSFLVYKASILPDKPLEEINVSDEDFIPIELFQDVISQLKHKQADRKSYWLEFIEKSKSEI